VNILRKSKKRALLESLDELKEQMPSLLEIDHPCAQSQISDACSIVGVCSVMSTLYSLNKSCFPPFTGVYELVILFKVSSP
jgi:hypothetical protein